MRVRESIAVFHETVRSGLTTQAQRPGTRDAAIANRDAMPGSLQRMVANQPSPRRGNDVSNKATQPVDNDWFISCYLRGVIIRASPIKVGQSLHLPS